LRQADRIVVLELGRIAEMGSHDELASRGGYLRRDHASSKELNGGTLVIQNPASPPC
jgi:ABC-type multidrug transport system fused ATPase/permease subunit